MGARFHKILNVAYQILRQYNSGYERIACDLLPSKIEDTWKPYLRNILGIQNTLHEDANIMGRIGSPNIPTDESFFL